MTSSLKCQTVRAAICLAIEPAREASRKGFWFNVGLGFGSLGCEDCADRTNGLSGGVSLGSTIGNRVLLGVGTSGWSKDVDGELLTIGTLDARVRVYPARRAGFFLTGGLGLGAISYGEDDAELGLGLLLGVGWDIRVGRNVSLTPFWNGFAMANESSMQTSARSASASRSTDANALEAA